MYELLQNLHLQLSRSLEKMTKIIQPGACIREMENIQSTEDQKEFRKLFLKKGDFT